MYSFLRYSVILVVLGLAAGCWTTEEKEKYMLVVFNEDGIPVEGAVVTPKADQVSFEAKETGPDGQVNLRGLYSEMPTMILVRAKGYQSVSVKWKLPSISVQTVTLKKR